MTNWYQVEFEEVLNDREKGKTWPWKEHFDQQNVFVIEPHYSQILGFLEERRFCLIEGAAGYGKTISALLIGYEYRYHRGYIVAQINVGSMPFDKEAKEQAITMIGTMDNDNTLFIVEDSHIKPKVTVELLEKAERCKKARFLFTMRTPAKQEKGIKVDDPFEDSKLRQQDLVVRLGKDIKDIENRIEGVTEKFWDTYSGELSRKNKIFPSTEDYQYLLEQARGNLRFLLYYLETWKDLEQPLALREVSREQVLNKFKKDIWEDLNQNQQWVYTIMAPLGQFEIPAIYWALFPSTMADIPFISSRDAEEALQEDDSGKRIISLRTRKLASKAGDYWMLADTESNLALEVQKQRRMIHADFDFEVLRTYILSNKATNYWQVFHSLHRAQERDFLVRLARDADVFDSSVARLAEAETTLSEALYVLRAVTWADKKKGLNLWHEYKNMLGGEFLGKIQQKLEEEKDIRVTTLLLQFLKNIDRESEAIPLADALPAEIFIDQVRLEVTGFAYVATIVKLLNGLVPEKGKQVMKGLTKSDYSKIGEKARHRNPQSIMWFLRRLADNEELKGFALPFLEGIGGDDLLEMVRVSIFSTAAKTMELLYELDQEMATQQVLKKLNESDFRAFGEKARQSSLQQIMWFFRWLADSEELKGFADAFLEAIGQDALRGMASSSPLRTIRGFRELLNKLSMPMAREFKQSLKPTLSDKGWTDKWANETVKIQSGRLWGWARELDPVKRERGKDLAKRLAEADKALRFGEGEEAEPVDKLQWLLYSAYWLDEDAAKTLAVKAAEAFDAESMQYSLEHLAYLLKNARSCYPNASHQLVEKIFESDAASLFLKGELNWFSQLVWEAVVSNEFRTREWVAEAGETFWVNLAANANPADAFRLLLVLWQANEKVGRKVIQAVGQQMIVVPELKDQPEAMPLLGLFAFCGLKPRVALSFSPAENISELYIRPSIRRLACSLFYLQESKPEAMPGFISAILTHEVMAPNFALLLDKYRLPWTTSTLQDILASPKSESREAKLDIYDRMILHFISMQPRRIYFGTMLNEIRSPQFMQQEEASIVSAEETEREEERKRSRAAIWLNKAIDKEIFTIEKKEHPITHKPSRLLDLNRKNHQVSFAIDMANSLLNALNNAQRDKEWATSNAWDDASFAEYLKGGSLVPSQLEYWKGILLKMGAIKADYQKTGDDRWIVTFCLDSTHPLVKALI